MIAVPSGRIDRARIEATLAATIRPSNEWQASSKLDVHPEIVADCNETIASGPGVN